ncbi:MAG TPA: hypothetical protein VNW72_13885 [Chthoniobacterales bacterium]|jgi:hypothetical protein|nr:hypothetical protein [Chthoniobacterales bacterium]
MKNAVYILGAGASKDFGLPLGTEVFDCAEKLAAASSVFPNAAQLKALLRQVENHLHRIFTNLPPNKKDYPPLEEVLTFLWGCKKGERFDYKQRKLISLFDNDNGVEGVFDTFVKMMAVTLAGCLQVNQSRNSTQTFTEFIKSLDFEKKNISFISLNYDVILDNALLECVQQGIITDYTYGIPVSHIEQTYRDASAQQLCRKGGVLLLKPHGSLNLVLCRRHRQCDCGEGFYYSKTNLIAANATELKCPCCRRRPEPLLIPPLFNKPDYVARKSIRREGTWRSTSEVYREWYVDRKIKEILGTADDIIVIGYSMPAYDYDFKTLLMTGLMQNENRRKTRLRIITKANATDAQNLKVQFERFAGSAVIEASDGFYDFLKNREN